MAKTNAISVGKYIYDLYLQKHNQPIDEMKLHKLLYFIQRESLIQTNETMFDETFYGWKYGPVLKEIREAYKRNLFGAEMNSFNSNTMISNSDKKIINQIYEQYSEKDSWSLSNLSHNEYSWKQSRKGKFDYEKGDIALEVDDIKKDALLQKMRRIIIQNNMEK